MTIPDTGLSPIEYFTRACPTTGLGNGPKPLVVFQGLTLQHKPAYGRDLMGRMTVGMFKFLGDDHTVYVVNRRPTMPQGYSLADMANDYATAIREEFGGGI